MSRQRYCITYTLLQMVINYFLNIIEPNAYQLRIFRLPIFLLTVLPRQPTNEEWQQHFMKVGEDNESNVKLRFGQFFCLTCGKRFANEHNINCHLNIHAGKNKNMYRMLLVE